MLEPRNLPIDAIYVPAKRKRTLEPDKVDEIAESMLEEGQQIPIRVRKDGDRFVLIEGLHRLEALKALGEETVVGYLVQARIR
ncbi:MAG: ParB N-terminal domain-containing protein [Pseudomonadota bacterium]